MTITTRHPADRRVKTRGDKRREKKARTVIDDPALHELPWSPFEQIDDDGPARVMAHPVTKLPLRTWFMQNSRYAVIVAELDTKRTWLSIRRLDRGAARDWRDFQRMKNELCGATWEAIELYPAESRLIDETNQYHLWCFAPSTPEAKSIETIGYATRSVVDAHEHEAEYLGAVQRPIEKVKP